MALALIDPSLISSSSDQKWVDEISKILTKQLAIDIKTPPTSIFQVPENLTTQKPEAYAPQQIGLGPIHHFQPGLYNKMEQKKLAAVQRVLKAHKIQHFERCVLDEVRKLIPVVRACYNMFIHHDDDSLAWVFAIDGLFLLDLFHINESRKDEDQLLQKNESDDIVRDSTESDDSSPYSLTTLHPEKRLYKQDIVMMENQIPLIVLKEIHKALQPSSSDRDFSNFMLRSFSKIHSPLELRSDTQVLGKRSHLLDYMYHSIVDNFRIGELMGSAAKPPSKMTGSQADSPADLLKLLHFMQKIPLDEIVQLYEQTVTYLKEFSESKTAIIPSASKLHHIAGIIFCQPPEAKGRLRIRFTAGKLHLPRVTLNNYSEITLRNLVAYETLMAKTDRSMSSISHFHLAEYVDLMCGLITNPKDVKFLLQQKIIQGELGDDEVAKLFNGMSSCLPSTETRERWELQNIIKKVNKVYGSKTRVKIVLQLKKRAHWLLVILTAIGGFVGRLWKIAAFFVSIGGVIWLTWKAYCEVYGCETQITLFPYASS